ncbi:hypothetical protein BD779DRAFT_1155680 [Infundibulicybe gibba]|nr:hypothetical protein BD779DRAFT_1155680 [Infundibulicybe gibba]
MSMGSADSAYDRIALLSNLISTTWTAPIVVISFMDLFSSPPGGYWFLVNMAAVHPGVFHLMTRWADRASGSSQIIHSMKYNGNKERRYRMR